MREEPESNTVPTTGRGYNRHITDAENSPTGVAADLYAPVPGDDSEINDTRDRSPSMTGPRDRTDLMGRESEAIASSQQRRYETRPAQISSTRIDRRREMHTDSGIMRKIQDNPLAVVAAATAGGMLIGRMMRNRTHRHGEGYLRSVPRQQFQDRHMYQPYQQPAFRPYQQPYGYQGYQQPGYQPTGEFRGAPQYRAEQEFQPGRRFEGSHENFPGRSNWD